MAGSSNFLRIFSSRKSPGRISTASLALKVLAAAVLLTAFYARFTELSLHFSHNDDIGVAKTIIDHKLREGSAWTAVPTVWTYAPLQFFSTQLLISTEHTYRELLFWGRLPSAAAGFAAVFLMFFFYRRYESENSFAVLTAAAIMACSWENIIHAKQMHNYALGVTAAVFILITLIVNFRKTGLSWKGAAVSGAVLGFCVWMHYEVLFFAPAFFAVLFIHALREKERVLRILGKMSVCAAAFLALFVPLWHFFIRRHIASRKDGWNAGPDGEFLLSWNGAESFMRNLPDAAVFYIKNLFVVLSANTAFVPEDHALYVALVYFLFSILFVFGIAGLSVSSDPAKKLTGLFFFIVFAVWCVLVAIGKLAFSPTRHNLILLPFMAVLIAEGISFLCSRTVFLKPRVFHGGISAVILLCFLFNYGTFLRERRDPFSEPEILNKLQSYGVDAVLAHSVVQHTGTMTSLRGYYGYYMPGLMEFDLISGENPPYKRVAWINHRLDLTQENYKAVREGINSFLRVRNSLHVMVGKKTVPYFAYDLEDFRVLFKDVRESDVEVDYSRRTKNGTNSYYFYILERIG